MKQLDYPIPITNLINALKKLPGIGTRGAERMALWMLQGQQASALDIEEALFSS